MTIEFTEAQEKAVTNLRETIMEGFTTFIKDTTNPLNKSAARRARKKTMEITKLLKSYRTLSIK